MSQVRSWTKPEVDWIIEICLQPIHEHWLRQWLSNSQEAILHYRGGPDFGPWLDRRGLEEEDDELDESAKSRNWLPWRHWGAAGNVAIPVIHEEWQLQCPRQCRWGRSGETSLRTYLDRSLIWKASPFARKNRFTHREKRSFAQQGHSQDKIWVTDAAMWRTFERPGWLEEALRKIRGKGQGTSLDFTAQTSQLELRAVERRSLSGCSHSSYPAVEAWHNYQQTDAKRKPSTNIKARPRWVCERADHCETIQVRTIVPGHVHDLRYQGERPKDRGGSIVDLKNFEFFVWKLKH